MSEQDLLPPPGLDELLDQALSKDLELLAAKGARGEPLSVREREILLRARDSRKSGVEPAFALEGEGFLAGLAKMTQAELGAIWGYSLRNVKNWVAAGREKNDPPPWAAPALMPAWFERVFSPRRCPAKLAAASQRLLASPEAAPAVDTPSTAPAGPLPLAEGETGLLAMLGRLRTAEATAYHAYLAAMKAGDENKASFLFSEWSKVVEKLRALEKSAPKALEELGIYIRRSDVARELGQLHGTILKSFLQGFRSSRGRLRATVTAVEWDTTVAAIVEEISTVLCESSFAEPLTLEVQAV